MYVPYLVKKDLNKKSFNDIEIIIITNNIQYPKNMAEIFQLAKIFRIKKIYISGLGVKPPFGKDLQKASQSAELKVEWTYEVNLQRLIKNIKSEGYKLIGFEYKEINNSVYNFSFNTNKIAIFLGNDYTGLSKELSQLLDYKLTIPNNLDSGYPSINLSLAILLTSIIINSNK